MTNSLRKMFADKVVIATVGFESDERDHVEAGIKNAIIGEADRDEESESNYAVGEMFDNFCEERPLQASMLPDESESVVSPCPITHDLLGNRIYGSAAPVRQLALFDKSDFTRTYPPIPAVVLRENGEKTIGEIDPRISKALTFTANDNGKQYNIPIACCNLTWIGEKSVIVDIPERNLEQHVSWYGMFSSCRLF